MDKAQLILAVVGALAAIAAAVFAYPSWAAYRAKPDLRLVIEPARSAPFRARLHNAGRGTATDWMVVIKMPRGGRFIPFNLTFEGWSDREVPEGWVATWMARGSDDTIGPELHRDVLLQSAGGTYPLRADYSIRANGMAERTGRMTVNVDTTPPTIRVT